VLPSLIYAIEISPSSEDDDEIVIERSVTPKKLHVLKEPSFDVAFGAMFREFRFVLTDPVDLQELTDEIEARQLDSVSIDYDRDCTYLSAEIDDVDCEIKFLIESISVITPKPLTALQLLTVSTHALVALNASCELGLEFDNYSGFCLDT
jgi:hypothetical protein